MSGFKSFLFVFACFMCLSGYVKGDEPKAEALRSNLQNHRYDESDVSKLHNIDPSIVKNSHRPQFFANEDNVASSGNRNTLDRIDVNANKNDNGFNSDVDVEDDDDDEEYKPNNHLQNKQNQIRTVLLRLMERKEQRRKFAEVLPILKVMTPPQRLAMAALISKQITADARNPGLNLDQVKAMFGNDPNVTSDLMLPILLDIANMVREAKDHIRFRTPKAPQAQLLRRSFSTDEEVDPLESHSLDFSIEARDLNSRRPQAKSLEETPKSMKIAAKIPSVIKNSNIKVNSDLKVGSDEGEAYSDADEDNEDSINDPEEIITVIFPMNNVTYTDVINNSSIIINGTIDEDLPVAEKLRALNRYIDRNGNLVILKRPPWIPDAPKYNLMQQHPNRKAEHSGPSQRRRLPISPMRKTPYVKQNCELFTNSLCLDTMDYPSDAIMGSIRRNQAAMTALLTDFPENSADYSIDGITAKQEKKYTPEYYINNMNRREDGSVPSASGFMCPSTVKYARPQKARATSGQWKYIVNTGEHTQTLRLEKCLRPREPCTYLTDNFKSKCVQVYNYHRLLTWDQQNGLHMDIFKVPTCCSCHIEGYSVAFPPHTSRPLESASEHFPGEDLHGEQGINPYEHIQPSIRHPIATFPGQDSFSLLGDAHNSIPGSSFNKPGFTDDSVLHDLQHIPISNQFDSINNNFQTDIYQQQSSNIRNVKKPPRVQVNEFGLPSYLEPPTKPALKNQDFQQKYKPGLNNHFKRGAPNQNKRPNRRPIRKKTSNTGDDQLIGASSVHENPTIINLDSFEDINESVDEYDRTSPRSTTTQKNLNPSAKITIKNVSPTTERNRPKTTPIQYTGSQNKEIPLRRVNYNYHPIIDFFEESKTDVATDRMDSGPVYLSSEDEWRPMAHPAAFPLKATADRKN